MQTFWDSAQQVIRILLYMGAGALVTAGMIDQATGTALVGGVLGVLNGLWTWWWNRRVATVKGLEARGASSAAVALEMAAKATRKKG